MILTPELAQRIAYKTTSILGHNVNIMNDAGIIIGSGDKLRLKCFHEGAYEVVRSGVAKEITIEDSCRLQGAKPGVNLPISYNNKIVGVVGITGSPDEVRQFGQLLTMVVETMRCQKDSQAFPKNTGVAKHPEGPDNYYWHRVFS
ncbi:MAG: hypothetical protein KGZ54_04905 [Dethiobacter sp.]|nr:hypothetical protein [Dethiobacter sp.]MBS3989578.1 hypothetical protein [Dethiobacter sp.]